MCREFSLLNTEGLAINVLTQKTVLGLVKCREEQKSIVAVENMNVSTILTDFHAAVGGVYDIFTTDLLNRTDSPVLKVVREKCLNDYRTRLCRIKKNRFFLW